MGPRPTGDVFADALLLSPEERAAFLHRECDADEGQRAEIVRLLAIADELPEIRALLEEPASDGPLPRMLGRYRLESVVGRGGMGIVYRARHDTLGHDVAVKVIRKDLPRGPDFVERLRREARTLASLQHPGLVTVHDLDEVDGETFVVMEWLSGETLAAAIRRERLPWRRAAEIALAVAEAVAAAHAKGVIHCDLKPANVMLVDGRVKVLDFGIARLSRGEDRATDPSQPPPKGALTHRAGTPGYMSPEQRAGQPLDPRTDVWSLGCLLHECLTGFSLHPLSLWGETQVESPRGRADLPSGVPLRLRRLIAECLAERRDGRPASADIVARELHAVLRVRGRANWILGVAASLGFVALGVVGLRFWATRIDWQDIRSARPKNGAIEVTTGRARALLPVPPGIPRFKETLVLRPARDPDSLLVVACTDTLGGRTAAGIVVWNRGLPTETVPLPHDWAFPPEEPSLAGQFLPRYTQRLSAVSGPLRAEMLGILVHADWYPSRFVLYGIARQQDGTWLRERFRFDHGGHIADLEHLESPSGANGWFWLAGPAYGATRERVGAHSDHTYFLAMLPDTVTGRSVFPPAGGATPSIPTLYFVISGVEVQVRAGREQLVWELSKGFDITSAGAGESSQAVLTRTNLCCILETAVPGHWIASWSITGDVDRFVRDRARRAGQDPDAAIRSFLADSVVTLLHTAPGVDVTGNFRDLR